MTFTQPEWFFLIPACLVLGLLFPALNIKRPLRLLLLATLSVLLTDPRIDRQQDALDLWVLLDRSESTEDLVDKGLPEWKKLLLSSKTTSRDQLHILDYAAEVSEQKPGTETSVFTGNRKLTRTNLAIQNALALSPEDRPSRILIFTDGYSTEPLTDSVSKLANLGIPVDFRLVREESSNDFRVSRLHMPVRTQIGEPFAIEVTVRGHTDGKIPLHIKRNGQLLSETSVELIQGSGRVEFTDRIPQSGSYAYSAEILPEHDAHPGNNRQERWIEVIGGPRVLLISKYTNDPLAAALRSQDYDVQIVNHPESLRVGQLAGARSVIFNNIPAFEVPPAFQDALNFFVREQGGGFLMVGGKQSFGSGGYFQSAIDPLLPVSMELKNEHRKLSCAMAIVMDRSGSMAVTAGGGKTKMSLANTGAARAVELLGELDQVCVFAVDSSAHRIVPLVDLHQQKQKVIGQVRKIRSQGGGIYVYTGLKAAWQELKKSSAGTRHIILFSDAADSEEPGNYQSLLDEMVREGASVSVIGLGSRKDSDAAFLEDIAKRGKGRCFFTNRPADIPRLFAQETVTVARSSFVTDPVGTRATGKWSEISAKPFQWLPQADGYNLSYARPDATTSLATTDEYLAPLVAHAHRGIGRTAAVSFPLGGSSSELVRAWPQYGDFIQTLSQWLMGDQLPPGIGIRHRLEGNRLTIDLLYDTEAWAKSFSLQAPRIRLLESSQPDTPYEVAWKRISPGRFSLSRELEEGSMIRGAIQVGKHAIPFGPMVVGSSTEWAFDPNRLAELRSLSAQSGGRELLDLSEAWQRPPSTHSADFRLPLGITALILLILDALVTRTGWQLPLPSRQPRQIPVTKRTPTPQTVQKQPTNQAPSPPSSSPPSSPPPVSPSESSRSSRFTRAKQRK
ncbi:VWA domain-containing protein [Verrucomicrobiaceae bacterium N1E253]|uniref:VWA domain-containing protein n=1 Tax=Oceaniferula marina TaxID=2748318 RepID=A0A851GKP9_9BACT|nr:VWA domain-containing protein [Oceaniferula marina]NWK56411.1 VWA domain-containing protein [Oceaniferula marina]